MKSAGDPGAVPLATPGEPGAAAPLRVAVVGAGAIGSVIAARLARLGGQRASVNVLARGATLDALRRDGLQLAEASGEHTLALRAGDDAAELGVHDVVIVAVKAPALAAAAPQVRALLAPQGRVLVAMNGVPWWFFHGLPGECEGLALSSVDPGGVIAGAIPADRVLGCVVHFSAAVSAPGHVRHSGGSGLIVGEPRGGAPGTMLARLTELLRDAGFAVAVSDRIQRDIWFKLWGNMTMNPVSALTGATSDRILDDDLVRGVVDAVMLEAQTIGARVGCAIDQSPADRHAVTRKLGAFKTSMLQDVEAGRAIELDALLGSVREIGQRLAVPTPAIDALFGLTRLMARQRGLYPAP